MATKLFLRWGGIDELPLECRASDGLIYTNLHGGTYATGSWSNQWLSTSAGTASNASALASADPYVAGPTDGVEAAYYASNWAGAEIWYSPPLSADFTISGSITFNVWAREVGMTDNMAVNVLIWKVSRTTGARTVLHKTVRTTELSTSMAARNWSETPTSTAFNRGDRIALAVFADDAGTMSAAGNMYVQVNSPTGGTAGDTYVTFTENLTFDTSPSGTTIYPVTASAGINPGSATELRAWTGRGSGVATAVTNTRVGPAAATQMTATAGGTAVEWYTPPLEATTLSGPVLVSARVLQSIASVYANCCCEIAICAGDGTGASVWGLNRSGSDAASSLWRYLTTTEAPALFLVAGDDTSISQGQRLRIRLFIDDANYNMVASQTVALYYAGASGATGDTYLTFSQTLTALPETWSFDTTLDAEIAATWGWVSPPADEDPISSTPTFTFTSPNPGVYPAYFQVELDTVDTFDGEDLVTYGISDGTWEYWDGDSWEAMPGTGMPASAKGNQARFTPPGLAETTWYRRIRYAVMDQT